MAREYLEIYVDPPLAGINVVQPRMRTAIQFSEDAQNFWPFDTLEGRLRGGQRAGLSKYTANQIDQANRIQDLGHVTTVNDSAPNTSTLGIRSIKSYAVCNGTIALFDSSSVSAANTTGSRSISNTAPFVFSAVLFGKAYFVDGISYKIWDAASNQTSDWTPTDGSLPGTDGTKVPRLIEQWRGRIVLSGLRDDPHNWFMSELGDALNWDYSPADPTEIQAVAGNVGVVGLSGDIINSLIPYSEDVLIIGCDSSIFQLSGDPNVQGRMDLLTDTVGIAFGRPWCMDSRGVVYFMSTKGSVYRMVPVPQGGTPPPEPLSANTIDPLLTTVNLNTHFVRMAWDEERYGFHLFISPFSAGSTTHFFYDTRTQGWFKTIFANNNHNPIATHVLDGDASGDRTILLGSEDGYIRQFDNSVANDDSTNIEATVIIGPFLSGDPIQPIILSELQAMFDKQSNTLKYEVMVGDTPEAAIDSEAGTFTGDDTFTVGTGGRSTTKYPRRRGYAIYVKVGTTDASSRWALEKIRVRIAKIISSKGRRVLDESIAY